MSAAVYEDVLERLAPVSPDLRRYLEFVKALDDKWRVKMQALKTERTKYIQKVRETVKDLPRDGSVDLAAASQDPELLARIETLEREVEQISEEKLAAANQAYDLLDVHLRKLLADVTQTEQTLRASGVSVELGDDYGDVAAALEQSDYEYDYLTGAVGSRRAGGPKAVGRGAAARGGGAAAAAGSASGAGGSKAGARGGGGALTSPTAAAGALPAPPSTSTHRSISSSSSAGLGIDDSPGAGDAGAGGGGLVFPTAMPLARGSSTASVGSAAPAAFSSGVLGGPPGALAAGAAVPAAARAAAGAASTAAAASMAAVGAGVAGSTSGFGAGPTPTAGARSAAAAAAPAAARPDRASQPSFAASQLQQGGSASSTGTTAGFAASRGPLAPPPGAPYSAYAGPGAGGGYAAPAPGASAGAHGRHGSVGEDEDGKLFCICQRPSFGEMVGCDNESCPKEWFHLACVGLSAAPAGSWYCPECTRNGKAPKAKAARSGRR